MLEMVVFALVLVGAQIVGGFIMMSIMMSKPFMKYFMKYYMKLVKELTNYYEELLDEMD